MKTSVTIVVSPEPRNPSRPPRKARFTAAIATGGRVLGAFSAPLCGSARVLLAEGVPRETVLQMRHAGSDTVALTTTVVVAADLTIEEEDSTGARGS
jgi:hypothetical protein